MLSQISLSAICLLVTGTLAEGIQRENEAGVLIVGGSRADDAAPYHLSLLKHDTGASTHDIRCGGVLVEVAGHQVGLTSSSCFVNDDDTSMPWDVMTGYTSIYYFANTQRTPVDKIVKHPSYEDEQLINDIAIMFFQPFEINDTAKTIPLPGTGQTTPQGSMTVSGWGVVSFSNQTATALRVLNVTVVADTVCEQDFGKDLLGVFCARNDEVNGTTPYTGDDGGPAVNIDGGYLAGIFIKANENTSAIFTDVGYFMTWIDTEVKEYYESYTPPSTTPTTTPPSTTPTTTPPSTTPTTTPPKTTPTTTPPSTAPTTTPSPSTLPPISSTSPPVTTTTVAPPTSTNGPSPSTNSTTLDPTTDSTTLDPSTNSTTPDPSSNPTGSTEDSSQSPTHPPNSAHRNRQNSIALQLVALLLSVVVFQAKLTAC